jgi:PadR family transcriptional regulator PadR
MANKKIRLSGPTLQVLRLFMESPRRSVSGADISRETGIGSGTMYPVLARLEGEGWLKSEWEVVDPQTVGRPRRRLYTITGLGQTAARDALLPFQMPKGALAWTS